MIKYTLKNSLTSDDVKALNEAAKKDRVLLLMRNTRGLNPELLKQLDISIVLSVLGGLDPDKKSKYNDIEYQERTYYSTFELYKIIKIFEKIESGIDFSWSETQKCMYVYKQLCEYIDYEHNSENEYENGRDVSRNLMGLLYRKSLCAGYGMIFKEAMDRIGIECEYQNRKGHHAWNVVKLDGVYRGIDLTWDSNGKVNGKCEFKHFGMKDDFYGNKHHDLSAEAEETKYPVRKFDPEEMSKNMEVICDKRDISIDMVEAITNNGRKYSYVENGIVDGFKRYIVCLEDESIQLIAIPQSISLQTVIDNNLLERFKYKKTKNYTRNNLTSFTIVGTKKEIKGVKEYIYLEIITEKNKRKLRKVKLLSESDLINVESREEYVIANNLLSLERKERKIRSFNGYVGYVDHQNLRVYYDSEFENNVMHVSR